MIDEMKFNFVFLIFNKIFLIIDAPCLWDCLPKYVHLVSYIGMFLVPRRQDNLFSCTLVYLNFCSHSVPALNTNAFNSSLLPLVITTEEEGELPIF